MEACTLGNLIATRLRVPEIRTASWMHIDLHEPFYSEQWKRKSVLPLPSPTLLATVTSLRSIMQNTTHIILCHPSDSTSIAQHNTTRGGG